jgi:predicted RNA-binding protein with PIN domain
MYRAGVDDDNALTDKEPGVPYIIDGHNLIPKTKGLHFGEIDDELELIRWLQVYCRVKRRKVEVYFDGAPPGQTGARRYGQVTAHFIRQGMPADEAIISRLQKMGGKAQNWIVVTSDHHIQVQARSFHTKVISSEDFSFELIEAQRQAFEPGASTSHPPMNDQEIEDWLRFFKNKKDQDD